MKHDKSKNIGERRFLGVLAILFMSVGVYTGIILPRIYPQRDALILVVVGAAMFFFIGLVILIALSRKPGNRHANREKKSVTPIICELICPTCGQINLPDMSACPNCNTVL